MRECQGLLNLTLRITLFILVTLSRYTSALRVDTVTGEDNSYLVEHKVNMEDATKAAFKLEKSELGTRAAVGCAPCSIEERLYCESASLFEDHCCCDSRLRVFPVPVEPLPFAPHVCLINLPPGPCTPTAGNCADYSRIMECCCRQILARRSEMPSWLPIFLALSGEFFQKWLEHRDNRNNTIRKGHDKLVSGAQNVAVGRAFALAFFLTTLLQLL